MKVIPSYLTSQLDSSLLGVVGWWQFDRSDFRFRNFWLDPAEVVSYALGLGFPRSPTVQDFLSARGENLVSGMSLARRGVPFLNYGRAYVEGIEAVGSHTYLRQADATMRSFLDSHRRIAERSEPSPALSTLLRAAADEFSHAEGVSVPDAASEHCFRRDQEAGETAFRLLDETRSSTGATSLGSRGLRSRSGPRRSASSFPFSRNRAAAPTRATCSRCSCSISSSATSSRTFGASVPVKATRSSTGRFSSCSATMAWWKRRTDSRKASP